MELALDRFSDLRSANNVEKKGCVIKDEPQLFVGHARAEGDGGLEGVEGSGHCSVLKVWS